MFEVVALVLESDNRLPRPPPQMPVEFPGSKYKAAMAAIVQLKKSRRGGTI
jgi:hypothetical protein